MIGEQFCSCKPTTYITFEFHCSQLVDLSSLRKSCRQSCVTRIIHHIIHFLGGKKHFSPLYKGQFTISLLSLKPTNFSLYIWEMSKYFQYVAFSVKLIKLQ